MSLAAPGGWQVGLVFDGRVTERLVTIAVRQAC